MKKYSKMMKMEEKWRHGMMDRQKEKGKGDVSFSFLHSKAKCRLGVDRRNKKDLSVPVHLIVFH